MSQQSAVVAQPPDSSGPAPSTPPMVPAAYQAPNPRYNSTLAYAAALAKQLVAQGYTNPIIVCNVLSTVSGEIMPLNGIPESQFEANGIPTGQNVAINLDFIFGTSTTGFQVLQNVGLIGWYLELGFPLSMFLPKQ